jgi:hypothetical protein
MCLGPSGPERLTPLLDRARFCYRVYQDRGEFSTPAGRGSQLFTSVGPQEFKQMFDNPLINAAVTFTEPFPIGLAVTLISAAVLPKK